MSRNLLLLGVPVAVLALAALDSSEAEAGAGPYGRAVIAAARASIGVREILPNNGPEIAAWAAELNLVPPLQWCGVAVSHWLREGAKRSGRELLVPGSGRAKALMMQFKAIGRLLTADEARARTLPPGTVLFWDRARVPGGPEGHTGVVEQDRGRKGWVTIEGNTDHNDVRRVERPRDDPRLLGAGLVDGPGKPVGASPAKVPAKVPPALPGPSKPPQGPATGRVLVGGDSLAVGLAGPLKAQLAPHPVQSFGVNGTTVAQWASVLGPLGALVGALQAGDLVLMSLGTNDAAGNVAPEAAAASARELVAFLRGRGARVGWIMPPELPFPAAGPLRLRLVLAFAEDGVPAFDSAAIEFQRAPDGVHATPAGYAQWAQAVAAWAREERLV